MIQSFDRVELHSRFQSSKLSYFIFGAKKILFCCDAILLSSKISFNAKNIVRMIQSFYSVELHSRFQSPKLPNFIFGKKEDLILLY
jgi:hypothetical protein